MVYGPICTLDLAFQIGASLIAIAVSYYEEKHKDIRELRVLERM